MESVPGCRCPARPFLQSLPSSLSNHDLRSITQVFLFHEVQSESSQTCCNFDILGRLHKLLLLMLVDCKLIVMHNVGCQLAWSHANAWFSFYSK